jgi:hypothetical protein
VIVSSQSLDSAQVTSELVRAHEIGKPIVPLLLELSHAELQSLRPDWSQAFGASASLTVPRGGILRALPRIVAGLAALGVQSDKGASRQQASGPSASSPPPSSVQLEASFDRESYRGDQDGEALMLVETLRCC